MAASSKLKKIARNNGRQDYSKYRKSDLPEFITNNTSLPHDSLYQNTVGQLQYLAEEKKVTSDR